MAFPVTRSPRTPPTQIGAEWSQGADKTSVHSYERMRIERSLTLKVFVRDDNVEQPLRSLKKKLQRDGLFREIKRRRAYEKPSQRKPRER